MFNFFLAISFPLVFILLLINFFQQEYGLCLFNLFQLLIFSIGYYISYKQKGLHFIPLLLVLLAFSGILTSFLFKNDGDYRLLIMLVAAVVLIDRNWQYILFAVFLSLSFVLIRVSYVNVSGMPMLLQVKLGIKIFFSLIVLLLFLLYMKHSFITYQKKLENALLELNNEKQQKERILNAFAHDLRSPISGISGISKLMLDDKNLSIEQLDFLKLIEQSSANAITLINDLIQSNANARDAYHFKHVCLNELIHDSLPLFNFKSKEKNIRLKLDIPDEKLIVNADPEKIKRVLANIVNNAIKFSHPGSYISVRIIKQNIFATMVIKDHGIGIPADKQKNIFDVFTDAKRKGTSGEHSTGLGLSICKQIVEVHKGQIYMESEEGKGSKFFVTLPLV